jgi:hyaluronan synthase
VTAPRHHGSAPTPPAPGSFHARRAPAWRPRLRRRQRKTGLGPLTTVLIFAVLAIVGLWHLNGITRSTIYGLAAFSLLGAKLLVSMTHRPVDVVASESGEPIRSERVSLLVPFYNEDPAFLTACLRSIARQTTRPQALHVIDDGSTTSHSRDAVIAMLPELREAIGRVELTVFPNNRGKRRALEVGFEASPDADLIVTCDSDTILDPAALEEAVKPFVDPTVVGVTGLVRAINHDRNWLTRLLDLRYANAFLYERAAYSMAGSVLCACGSLAVWRASVLRPYISDFVSQRFLGRPAIYGDDRRLTNYALKHGKVVLQDSAIAYTAVPERITHFIRQQVRWNKSFFRESLWAIRNLPTRSPAFLLSLLELTSWLTFSIMLALALIVHPFTAGAGMFLAYVLYLSVMSYARSIRYLQIRHPDQGAVHHLGVFLLSPLYGFIHIFLLVPLRFYSLFTLGAGSWGTRVSGVEVALGPRSNA